MESPVSVLIVEANLFAAHHLKSQLEDCGYNVLGIARSGDEALRYIVTQKPNLALVDIDLKETQENLSIVNMMYESMSGPTVLLAKSTEETSVRILPPVSNYGYLMLPCDKQVLHATIQIALSKYAQEREIQKYNARLRLVLETSKLGLFDWDIENSKFTVSGAWPFAFTKPKTSHGDTLEDFLSTIHQDDRDRVEKALATSIFENVRINLVFRCKRPGGDTRYVKMRGQSFVGGLVGATRVIGVLQEVGPDRTRVSSEVDLSLGVPKRTDQLSLYYAPVFDLGTGELALMEAWPRWRASDNNWTEPRRTVPIPDALNQAFLRWLFVTACRDVLSSQNATGRRLCPLSLNLSSRQLTDFAGTNSISALLNELAFPPNQIEVEISEYYANDLKQLQQVLARLGEHGTTVALDDFTGQSGALQGLTELPVNRVKFDLGSLRNGEMTHETQVVIKAIVTMAHSLGVSVTARGIQSEQQADWLRQLGCDEGQGPLFGHPVNSTELDLFTTCDSH